MNIIVGITGASGFVYGLKTLELLRAEGVNTHLIVSGGACLSAKSEGRSKEEAEALATYVYDPADLGAAISSGSFHTDGMIVAPSSARTLAAIATGNTYNLLTRAAEVTLKERRKLVLMFRESPLHLTHIRNMLAVTEMGGIVCPPVPSFYADAATVDDIVTFTTVRALDQLGIRVDNVKRWGI
jgi:4-hydroxy-3-polyprenylbenzoate decarboxylase